MPRGGKRPGAGRRHGSTNASTQYKQAFGAEILPDALEAQLWQKYLTHTDKRIAWEAFKMAKEYKSGKPPQNINAKVTDPIIIKFTRDPETPAVTTADRPQL